MQSLSAATAGAPQIWGHNETLHRLDLLSSATSILFSRIPNAMEESCVSRGVPLHHGYLIYLYPLRRSMLFYERDRIYFLSRV